MINFGGMEYGDFAWLIGLSVGVLAYFRRA